MAKGEIIISDIGSDNIFYGWAAADQALRLMTGNKAVANENIPLRAFNQENVGELELTEEASNSGEWYMPPSEMESGYLKLWGIEG
jgi:ribose transport system substrate-binding protein